MQLKNARTEAASRHARASVRALGLEPTVEVRIALACFKNLYSKSVRKLLRSAVMLQLIVLDACIPYVYVSIKLYHDELILCFC